MIFFQYIPSVTVVGLMIVFSARDDSDVCVFTDPYFLFMICTFLFSIFFL